MAEGGGSVCSPANYSVAYEEIQSNHVLQISLLLMKNLNKTETPIFLSVACSLFPKATFLRLFYYTTAGISALWRR